MPRVTKPTVLGTIFIGTIALTLAGLTFGGEAKDFPRPDPCAHADWPMIPPACLDGGAKTVRYVFAYDDRNAAMASRFSSDFE